MSLPFLIVFLSELLPRSARGIDQHRLRGRRGGALGYFASLILHELGHALASRRLGIPILGIDLWFFGGMASPTREPETPGEEFKVSAAGPAATFAVWSLCVVGASRSPAAGTSQTRR